MIDLRQQQELIVRQHVEHLEVFTGFETENRYVVMAPDGETLLYAFEESAGFARFFLKGHRPLDIHIVDRNQNGVLTASRSFYWLFSHLHVSDGSGRHVGTLNRRFGLLKRRFSLSDSNGRPIGQILGSLFRVYTFSVENDRGVEVARITKQWSGLMREMVTDADTFQVQFTDATISDDFRLLVLASAFAIDLDFFER